MNVELAFHFPDGTIKHCSGPVPQIGSHVVVEYSKPFWKVVDVQHQYSDRNPQDSLRFVLVNVMLSAARPMTQKRKRTNED